MARLPNEPPVTMPRFARWRTNNMARFGGPVPFTDVKVDVSPLTQRGRA